MRIKPYWTTPYLHSLHHLHNTKQYNKESKHDIQVKPSYHIKKQPVQTNKSTSRSSIKYKTTSKPIIQLNYKVMHCKSNYISTIRNKHAKKITPNCRLDASRRTILINHKDPQRKDINITTDCPTMDTEWTALFRLKPFYATGELYQIANNNRRFCHNLTNIVKILNSHPDLYPRIQVNAQEIIHQTDGTTYNRSRQDIIQRTQICFIQ